MTVRKKDIKVGVIGYGGAFNMGHGHLMEMQAAGMTPVAVCELDPERRAVAQTDFPEIETYASAAAMLKKSAVNLITIITPHNTHARLALACLKAGRHVVCEKPFAIRTSECQQMMREARKRGLCLSTYHNRHWDGCVLAAVENVVKKRVIGDVVRIHARGGGFSVPGAWWRSSKKISGGILYDWGVHYLEYCLQLIDEDMLEVSGYAHNGIWAPRTAWKDDTVEDDAQVVVRFTNHKTLNLTMSNIDTNLKPGGIEVTGSKGTYWFDLERYEITLPSLTGNEHVIRGRNPAGQWHRYYQNVANHLSRGTKLVITPEWASRTIHILDLADQSARKGHAIRTTIR